MDHDLSNEMVQLIQMCRASFAQKNYLMAEKYGHLYLENLEGDFLRKEIAIIIFTSLFEQKKYDTYIRLSPNYETLDSSILLFKAESLKALSRKEDAVVALQRGVELFSDNFQLFYNLGLTYYDLSQFSLAIMWLEKALSLNPNSKFAYLAAGMTFRSMLLYLDANECFRLAYEIDPTYEDSVGAYGQTLKALGNFDASLELYEKYVEATGSKSGEVFIALSLLSQQKLREGFAKYESRLSIKREPYTIQLPVPDRISEITSKTIIVGEQGVGDTIFFFSFLSAILDKIETHITVAADFRLIDILERSFGDRIKFIVQNTISYEAEFESFIPIGSLGHLMQIDNIGAENFNPYLVPHPIQTALFKSKIADNDKIKIGISWISKNTTNGALRSIALQNLLRAFPLEKVKIISLQYGDDDLDFDQIAGDYGVDHDKAVFIDKFADLDGLASLIAACDIIVTVDNSTAHLACALGKPTFILLAYDADWRWFMEGSVSPWYPTATLIRQQKLGDWSVPLDEVYNIIQGY